MVKLRQKMSLKVIRREGVGGGGTKEQRKGGKKKGKSMGREVKGKRKGRGWMGRGWEREEGVGGR